MDANQLKELTEYFDSRYVQKDTCAERHLFRPSCGIYATII